MSNHFSDPNLVPDVFKQRPTIADLEAILQEKDVDLEILPNGEARVRNLGATGRYPEGKLGEHDEGEIAFAVAADNKHKKVLIDFGKPVAFLGMTREQAAALAHLLIQKALEIK